MRRSIVNRHLSIATLGAASATRSALRDRRGTVALIFALVALVLVEFVGAAVDFGTVYRVRTLLNDRSDAATLAAVASRSAGYQAASGMTGDGTVEVAADEALSMFNAQPVRGGFTLTSATATATRTGNTLTVNVAYTASIPTMFLGLIGMPSIAISGQSTASSGLPTYIDFYFLLDNSPSMGVAATQDGINTMVANTPDSCAFACHDQSNPNNYYNLAHRLGVSTRIDVLRQATQQLMTTASNAEVVPDQFRVQVNTFNMTMQTAASLSSDLASVTGNIAAVDLMPVPYQGWFNDRITDYQTILRQIGQVIPDSGSGSSPSSPQQVLFIVTDGVADYAQGSNRIISPMDPQWCNSMKARGIKIAILYTTYLPLPTNGFYMANVAPWVDTIAPKLEACASPNYFYEVSVNQAIGEAMNRLFLTAVKSARITN